MSELERYKKIKSSFLSDLNYLDNDLIYNNIKLDLIDGSVPNFINKKLDNLTNTMSDFYNDVKFPNYDDCEDYASLYDKGRSNLFTKRLDDELNFGSKVLELGCGTGQLSLFLSRCNREIYGVDISNGSLILGEKFRLENNINNAYFMKMDVFDLKFKKDFFDFTISNGVLHHTKDARKAFRNLVTVTKPGGIIAIGLYHKYGRFFTKVKQRIAKVLGKNIFLLDKNSLKIKSKDKRDAWVIDQFMNPHETLHTPSETMKWFEEDGVDFVNLIPHCDNVNTPIFMDRPKPSLSYFKEILMTINRKQIQEGGFFIMIGKKI
ncbi:class I SAM-dependent methyltransferase [Prochlorococcus sp. MIT 0604]|uniref:class I SAM-dependent methyltransferase n=1 Tax=Prochlorococcus sp. MIT 0604 TaxID=1501268 RepID=UPI0004F8C5F9|nr:class I SAM-dependent methyltransferase [Prochlorococcus sp. MIT 0604]AIQ94749.1 hypothetical protein EW14_0729 [Prochlorococcus sp. MIT 0604]